MKQSGNNIDTGVSSPDKKQRNMKDYYSVLIKLNADAMPKKKNAGSGNAPEDPSLEHGKVR